MNTVHLSEETYQKLAHEAANRLFGEHYFAQGAIHGETLKDFCAISQVNKFLLFQVYQVWQTQIGYLRHPFFDLEHPEVEQQLRLLQNLLSRHISIKKDDFKPLLQQAVYNNLKLLFEPEQALKHFFFQERERLPIEVYARYAPFFSDFDFAVLGILHYAEKNGMRQVDKDIFSLKLDKAVELYAQKSGESALAYRAARVRTLTGRDMEEIADADAREQAERETQRLAAEAAARQREALEAEREKAERLEAEKAEAERIKAEQAAREAEKLARQREEEAKNELQSNFFDTLKPEGNFVELTEDPAEAVVKLEEEKSASAGPGDLPEIPIEVPPLEIPETAEPEPAPEPAPEPETPVVPATPEERKSFDPLQDHDQQETHHDIRNLAEMLKEQSGARSVLDNLGKAQEGNDHSRLSALTEHSGKKSLADQLREKNHTHENNPHAGEEKHPDPVKEPTETKPEAPAEPITSRTPLIGPDAEKRASVMDRFKKTEDNEGNGGNGGNGGSVMDRIRQQAGVKIKAEEIPLHKQYQFVQKVFSGNSVRFRTIIEKANNARSAEEVEEIINKFVLGNAEVDASLNETQEFLSLLRSRYAMP